MSFSLATSGGMANKDRSFHEAPQKAGGEGWLYSEQQQKLCHYQFLHDYHYHYCYYYLL